MRRRAPVRARVPLTGEIAHGGLAAAVMIALCTLSAVATAADKSDVLLIMSDDVCITNISAYGRRMAGYWTPDIDRIANEGVLFTDYYAEQSCTAARSDFITGQSLIRTGLTKFGFPGASIGLQKEPPTLAEMLKPHGYATGPFGKNHLGDRNEFLPTSS